MKALPKDRLYIVILLLCASPLFSLTPCVNIVVWLWLTWQPASVPVFMPCGICLRWCRQGCTYRCQTIICGGSSIVSDSTTCWVCAFLKLTTNPRLSNSPLIQRFSFVMLVFHSDSGSILFNWFMACVGSGSDVCWMHQKQKIRIYR